MTASTIIEVAVPLFCVLVVPTFVHVFRTIRKLELENVEMKAQLTHIDNNYKQCIDHLNQEVEEIKDDIKKLLKYAYMRAGNEGSPTTKMEII